MVRKNAVIMAILFLPSIILMCNCIAPQSHRGHDDKHKRVHHEYQDIGANSIGVQHEAMEGMLLQDNGIVDGKRLCDKLNRRRRKRYRPQCAAQEKQECE